VTTYFGAVKRGAIPVPVNMRLQREGIEYVLGDAGARAVVTTGSTAYRKPRCSEPHTTASARR
jgi:acyl-CoA synthetase (AMP-forming)/AMP-acid ligase II